MATVPLRYSVAALSDQGRKRASNEDAFGYSAENGIFVVCDGMGGAAAGEVASALAVETVLGHFLERNAAAQKPEAAVHAAEEAILAANHTVYSRASQEQVLNGMGTTLVALVAQPAQAAWFLNIGDSRGYLLRGNRLNQVTLDHSFVGEQIRMGRLTQEEALRSPLRNVITRALGTRGQVPPDVFELDPEPGDLYLLCTDGLTREISDEEIESILLAGQPLEELCKNLIDAANRAGGSDNITCMLVRASA